MVSVPSTGAEKGRMKDPWGSVGNRAMTMLPSGLLNRLQNRQILFCLSLEDVPHCFFRELQFLSAGWLICPCSSISVPPLHLMYGIAQVSLHNHGESLSTHRKLFEPLPPRTSLCSAGLLIQESWQASDLPFNGKGTGKCGSVTSEGARLSPDDQRTQEDCLSQLDFSHHLMCSSKD